MDWTIVLATLDAGPHLRYESVVDTIVQSFGGRIFGLISAS